MMCALGSDCVAFDRETGESMTTHGGPVCPWCLVVAERDIVALKWDYRDLEQLLPRGSGAGGQRVSGSSEPSTPLQLHVEALQADMAWTLTAWEPIVRELANLSPERARHVRRGWAVATAVDVIAPRVSLLARVRLAWGAFDGLTAGFVERDGVYALASMRALHRRCRSVLGLTRRVVRLPGACSGCSATALEREDGSEDVRCGHCGRRWSPEEYTRYVGMVLATGEQS